MGRRVNLADLASDPGLPDVKVPSFVDGSARTARLDSLAPNPLNSRDIDADSAKIADIAKSMQEHGQLQPCAVVSRAAFLRIFPEHEPTVGQADFVQVTGGRRYAAATSLGLASLDIAVKDAIAGSRVRFISATAAENLDRQDYDPIEEARQVQILAAETGSGKATAEALNRTPGWVTHRLNLLKLVPEVQSALRTAQISLREVRTLHTLDREGQLAALHAWIDAQQASISAAVSPGQETQGGDDAEQSATPSERRRSSPTATAIRRLGGTPDKIAESLRSELSAEDLHALITLLRCAL